MWSDRKAVTAGARPYLNTSQWARCIDLLSGFWSLYCNYREGAPCVELMLSWKAYERGLFEGALWVGQYPKITAVALPYLQLEAQVVQVRGLMPAPAAAISSTATTPAAAAIIAHLIPREQVPAQTRGGPVADMRQRQRISRGL